MGRKFLVSTDFEMLEFDCGTTDGEKERLVQFCDINERDRFEFVQTIRDIVPEEKREYFFQSLQDNLLNPMGDIMREKIKEEVSL